MLERPAERTLTLARADIPVGSALARYRAFLPQVRQPSGAIVIQTVDQERTADELYEVGKGLDKAIEAHYAPLERQVRDLSATLRSNKAADKLRVADLLALKLPILEARDRRRQAEERERAEARRKLEAEARERQEREARELEAQAKATRDRQAKADLKAQAEEIREAPVQVSQRAVDAVAPSADAEMESRDRWTPWTSEVYDEVAFFAATATIIRPDLRPYWKLDLVALNRRVAADAPVAQPQKRADGSLMADIGIPGVRAVRRKTLV